MRTPKQPSKKEAKYKYYAGFSDAFVADVLDRYATSNSRVLDPWNGSGMTTATCAARGIRSVGMDINPATLPVAWARLARSDLTGLLCERLTRAKPADMFTAALEVGDDDLLAAYFTDHAGTLLRSLRNYLISTSAEVASGLDAREVRATSGVAFVVLAEVIREALRPVRGTNPSWFSRPRAGQHRISVDESALVGALTKTADAMRTVARDAHSNRPPGHAWPELVLGDSRLELSGLGNFDLIITSPPYCTRIDYAVATTPELLALGSVGRRQFSALRQQIIGSVVTEEGEPCFGASSSPTLRRTLEAISHHPTKAASTYYARYFTKYFSDLVRSLSELAGAVRAGYVVLVVQNSFFKDIEIDLRQIVTELLQNTGLVLSAAWKHPAKAPIAGSNPRFRVYRDSNVSTEDILVFSTH
jgi:hypothetical protein